MNGNLLHGCGERSINLEHAIIGSRRVRQKIEVARESSARARNLAKFELVKSRAGFFEGSN